MTKIKSLFFAVFFFVALGVSAQFSQGTKTLSGSLTGFDFGLSGADGLDDFNVDLGVNGSYFVIDNLAVTAGFGIGSYKAKDVDAVTNFNFEIGGRYYFWEALYGGIKYRGEKYQDVDLLNFGKIEVGYDYYITENVFFEPAIYFEKGFGDSNKWSNLGLSIGIGVNF